MRRYFLMFALMFLLGANASPESGCSEETRSFVCGVNNAEDLVHVARTPWIVASQLNWTMSGGSMVFGPGPLVAIRSDTREVRSLFPSRDMKVDWDKRNYQNCSHPPQNPTSHGLNILAVDRDRFRLYAVNHGERESIEILDLDVRGPQLLATWRGCLHTPGGARADSVAPLMSGAIVVSLLGGAGPSMWEPHRGWTKIDGLGEYDHGIEVSRDGRWLYLVLHRKEGTVVRVPIDGGATQTVLRTNFVPDSLRWGEDGGLYVTGFFPDGVKECFNGFKKICDTGFAVERIDPDTLETRPVLRTDGIRGAFGAATTAVQFNNELWVGTWFGDRIAIFPLE